RQFNGRRGKAIFPEHEKNTGPAKHDERVARQGRVKRHVRPAEAVIDGGNHEKPDEAERRHAHDDLLNRLLLGKGSAAHPPRQQRRVLFHQIEGERERACKIHGEEHPSLPVRERPCRGEQQERHHEEEDQQAAERFLIQRTHRTISARAGSGPHVVIPSRLIPSDHCCFSQNDSRPCDAEPPITQGIPTAIWPSAAADTQPSATAPTPTWPQKSRLRLESDPLVLSSSTAASASFRTAASCTVSAASTTSASGTLTAAGWRASSPRRYSRNPASRTA